MNAYRFIRYYLFDILNSIYFNIKYLPLRQAIKLPILLSNVRLAKTKGSINIQADKIKFGMILIGDHRSDVFPRQKTVFKNKGGKIIFKGDCIIGSSSSIVIFEKGVLVFGHNFKNTSSLSIVCTHYIQFGESVLVGWSNIFIDSSFHRLKDKDGRWKKGRGFAPIVIGRNNWFGLRCTIYKGTSTPDYCILGGNSILNKDYTNYPSYVLLAGNPIELKAENIWRDPSDDLLEYDYYVK